MASLRNTSSEADDAILAAARESVLQVGVRRTTATEVARRAGISRMTLYRRFGDMDSVLVALLTHEIQSLLGELAAETTELTTGRERLVATALLGVERMAADPLLARLVELDPELLLPYLVDRVGTSHHATRAALAAALDEGQADGSIRPLDGDAASWVLVVVLQAFVFAARMLAAETDPAAVRAELRRLLDGYLAP
jgi:AcrR family transcriptional regulator